MCDRQHRDVDGNSSLCHGGVGLFSRSLWFIGPLKCVFLVMCGVLLSSCGCLYFVGPSHGGNEVRVVLFSPMYFFCCFLGGMISGLPHTVITPIDLVKCRMQVGEYEYMSEGFRLIYRDSGRSLIGSIPSFYRGWVPTLIGYSLQGGLKFFFYELFKYLMLERHETVSVRTAHGDSSNYVFQLITFLSASFIAEMVADVALAPWEALKIKIQTTSVHRTQVSVVMAMVWNAEGCRGFYKGLTALWCRQVPYTVVKFMSFESISRQLYFMFVSTPRSATPKGVQILISLIAGVLTGLLCAIVSHPSDTIVSKLNQRSDATISASKNTLFNIMRDLGWRGLWKGICPRILMVGALTAMQWVLYDGFKVLIGLPTTGGTTVTTNTVLHSRVQK